MRIFRASYCRPLTYQFDGDYKWCLPSVRCGTCNRPHASRLGCPNLDIQGKLEETPYKSAWPVTRLEFEKLVEPLNQLRTPEIPQLLPGMGFGPFLGKVMHKEKRDFLWIFGTKVAIREECYQRLTEAGLVPESGPAILKDSKTKEVREDYHRVIVTKPVKCMSAETLPFTVWKECSECGLTVLKEPKRLFVKNASIPLELPIFAVEETESIVVSEEFASVAKNLGLTNIEFEAVEVV